MFSSRGKSHARQPKEGGDCLDLRRTQQAEVSKSGKGHFAKNHLKVESLDLRLAMAQPWPFGRSTITVAYFF